MDSSTLRGLMSDLAERRLDYVDSREWKANWSEKWVAFVDLIGIAARANTSPAATVNQMVRFHRAVASAEQRHENVRTLRFTDGMFATSSSVEQLIKFVSDLQHLCLAMNALALERPKCLFHHLIVPRVTIAHGDVLDISGRPPVEDRLLGVDPNSLLIGSGVVRAYMLEKRTVGGLASASITDGELIRRIPIRGINRPPRRLLARWSETPSVLTHDGVVDIPWLLLRAEQPDGEGLWATTYEDVLYKLQVEVAMWKLSFTEYTSTRLPVETIKHFGGVQRHLNELFQGLKGHKTVKAWGLSELESSIGSERSRAGL